MNTKILLILSLLSLSACGGRVSCHGYLDKYDKLSQVNIGYSKEEVLDTAGSPTNISFFDDARWYYMTMRSSKNNSILRKNKYDYKVVIISFKDDLVSDIKIVRNKNAQEPDFSYLSTKVVGDNSSWFNKLVKYSKSLKPKI